MSNKQQSDLDQWLDRYNKTERLSAEFREASTHNYGCKCDGCRAWWKYMGPDPETGKYGPFGTEGP